MAIRMEIDNGDLRGRVDYTPALLSTSQSPVVLRDRVNLPALLDFSLVPAGSDFVAPTRGAYVRLTGLADALPAGGPRVPGPLFTGYVTNEPVIEYLGVREGKPLYGYRYQATSEEYLLNVKRIGLVPPFVSQTAGQILRLLADLLQPGRFDVTGIAEGPVVPFFRPEPEASWSEVARELGERSGYAYRVLDAKIQFQPLTAEPANVVVREGDRRFRPEALEVTPLGNPIHNDVTVIGGIEPQACVAEHFIGDGFTSRFALSSPAYGAESARLLADDFTGTALDTSKWKETDPSSCISLFQGRLNVTGGTGTPGETTLDAQQAVELGGELELLHGEFEFVSPSSGILGGLYAGAGRQAADCLIGFDVSPIGASSRVRPLIQGAVLVQEIPIQPGHHYVLITRLSTDQPHRTQETFSSLSSSYGGATLPAVIRVVLEVRDIDPANPAAPTSTILYDAVLLALPAFAAYAPINSTDLHVVANFLQVTRPIQARLETALPGQAPRIRALGFGIAGHDATISSDPHSNQWTLEFYEDTIPARGEHIVLRYRAAGRARARVRDAASVAAEQALTGDDGVRAAVLHDLQPEPRTSAEAELAAQAYLQDRTSPQYEGRYGTWAEFCEGFPRAGRLLAIEAESRYPTFQARIRGVTSLFRELSTERIEHTIEFGQASFFAELLRQFTPQEGILAPHELMDVAPVDAADIGTQFLDDVPGFQLASTLAEHFVVDMGTPPPAGGGYEVRRSDQGWGSSGGPGAPQNLIGSFPSQSFVLPRSSRSQLFFIRPVDGTGKTSRFSSAVAVRYPLVPAQPTSIAATHGKDDAGEPVFRVEIALAENSIADVDRLELRDSDNSTVLAAWDFGQLVHTEAAYRATHVMDNSAALLRTKTVFAYTQNTLGEYSIARSATGTKAEPAKPSLAAGNSVGQILEILLDRVNDEILETQIQVAGPGEDFSNPSQSVVLPGQPDKFSFVATSSGGWAFRARRRDVLGWSPWSNEAQGQIPPEITVFTVSFFQARELDPSIGAAINSQNLLPNSEFFLPGIAGQDGAASARYHALVNAAANGSEVVHAPATNEMKWNAGVNFGTTNPGFRTLLSNLGRLFNPGEAVTLSAALRHQGTGSFPNAIRLAQRSASTPSYDRVVDVPAGSVQESYRWFTATYVFPANQAVPADLYFELTLLVNAGQSIASALVCDKVILSRGHRPAAYGPALWDAQALAWNAAAAAYDLPSTAVAATQRSADSGGAGLLAGTGTEDLDPDFASRFSRFVA